MPRQSLKLLSLQQRLLQANKELDLVLKNLTAKNSQYEAIQSQIDSAEAELQRKLVDIRNVEEKARTEARIASEKEKKALQTTNDVMKDSIKWLKAEISELEGDKTHLLRQIIELKDDLEDKNRSKTSILRDLDNKAETLRDKIKELTVNLANIEREYPEKVKNLDNKISEQQTSLSDIVNLQNIYKKQNQDLEKKKRNLEDEIKIYESGITQSREDDEARSNALRQREQSLDAKQRAFYEEKKQLNLEKRQFYAVRSLSE